MAQAVVVTSGEVPIEGRAAVPVYVDNTLPAVGPARNVIVVTSGPMAGGAAMPVVEVTGTLPGIGPALPVYVVSGSLGISTPVEPSLSAPSVAALNTTATNRLGPDGISWANVVQPTIDQYGKLLLLVSDNTGGPGLVFVRSNDSGTTWADLSTPGDGIYPIPVTRAAMAYDSMSDAFHVIYAGAAATGILYRRYTPTRDGSHNITALTKDANTNAQLDLESTGTMDYQHPIVFWLSDIGTKGALVVIWHAYNTGTGGPGTEIRAAMRVLTNTSADGNVANWTHLGVNSSTGIGNAPAVAAYTALFSTTTNDGAIGWPCAVRKSAGAASHAKDLYYFFTDIVGGVVTWKFRRLAWATSDWSSGLSAITTVGSTQESGTNAGYTLKYQIGSKPVEDTAHDAIVFGYSAWRDNTNGDTWQFKSISSADTVSAATYVYNATAANCGSLIFVTGDLHYDTTAARLVASYTNLPNKDARVALYNGATQTMAPLTVYSSTPVDIPTIFPARIGGKLILLFRNFNVEARQNPPTYTPPYVGYWATVTWS